MEIKGFIEKAWNEEEGESLVTKSGNEYGKILIQGKTISIFDGKVFSALSALKNQGMGVVIEVEQAGKFTNYKSHRGDSSMSEAPESKPGRSNGGGGMDAYAEKDRRITRVAIAKSLIEASEFDVGWDELEVHATRWFNWVYEQGTAPAQESAQSVSTLPEREEPQAEGEPICFDVGDEGKGIPITREQALADLNLYIQAMNAAGKTVFLGELKKKKNLNACSDDELAGLFEKMRTEQEAI